VILLSNEREHSDFIVSYNHMIECLEIVDKSTGQRYSFTIDYLLYKLLDICLIEKEYED